MESPPEMPLSHPFGFPILSLLILLPLVLSIVLRLARTPRLVYRLAALGAGVELALTALVFHRFQSGQGGFQFVERLPLGLGVSYHVGVDGISVLFLPLIALLTLLVVVYARQADKASPRAYLIALFGVEAALLGAFVSMDLMLFWLFTTLEIVPSAALIRRWGVGSRRRLARRRYVSFGLMSAAVLFTGIVLLGKSSGQPTFDLLALRDASAPESAQTLIFFLLFLGFAVRVPLFPFHGWLPMVMEEGPTAGVNIFLAGVKLGAYGFLRFVIPLVPEASSHWAWLVTLLGVVGMVYGALLALVQSNLRRLLAFACVSQMGSVMVGLFSLNFEGLQGGLAAMLNMGVAATGLYFVAAFLYTRLGSAKLTHLGGLSQYVPLLTLTFLVVALATIGMPLTSGFEAEHLVLLGALDANHLPLAIGAAMGSLLAAAYLFRYYQHAFLGPARASAPPPAAPPGAPPLTQIPDLRVRELIIAGSLTCLIVGFGLFSGPLFDTMAVPLKALAEHAEQHAHIALLNGRSSPDVD